MQLVNGTPWSHLLFERADAEDRAFWVLVLQGSYRLGRFMNDRPSPLHPVSPALLLADEYRGQPSNRSLRRAGAIATYKPQSDITVDAVARSARPRDHWDVGLRVGTLQHRLSVLGPHRWRHDATSGWVTTDPDPCTEVPLIYEKAFGGSGDVDGRRVDCRDNPLGTGFRPRGSDDRSPFAAAQVLAPDEPIPSPGQVGSAKGWAPLPPFFAPRCDAIGTVDAAWRETRWPRLPADFDDAYYQTAHPDLIYPGHLRGDELIEVHGVTADERPIRTRLPGWQVKVMVHLGGRRFGGDRLVFTAHLDTLHLDLASPVRSEHRVHLTWRARMPISPAFVRAEVGRMAWQREAA